MNEKAGWRSIDMLHYFFFFLFSARVFLRDLAGLFILGPLGLSWPGVCPGQGEPLSLL